MKDLVHNGDFGFRVIQVEGPRDGIVLFVSHDAMSRLCQDHKARDRADSIKTLQQSADMFLVDFGE